MFADSLKSKFQPSDGEEYRTVGQNISCDIVCSVVCTATAANNDRDTSQFIVTKQIVFKVYTVCVCVSVLWNILCMCIHVCSVWVCTLDCVGCVQWNIIKETL